jgi:signal transduction histidine kinase
MTDSSRHNSEVNELQTQVMQRDKYLQGIVEMQTVLLSIESEALGALNPALAPLGEASGTDRVYIFENDKVDDIWSGSTSQKAEWCAPGIEPQIDSPDLQGVNLREFFPEWYKSLDTGNKVVRVESSFDEVEQEVLGPQGIKSLLVLPLMLDGTLTGFIGFDNCREEYDWNESEVSLLQSAASQISLNLAQRRAKRSLEQLNATLEDRIAHRTMELAEKNNSLSEALSTLQRAQADLMQAEKLTGLGRMVAGVAHELRNPANYVGNNVKLLAEHLERLQNGLSELIDDQDPDNSEVLSWLNQEFDGANTLITHSSNGIDRIRDTVHALVNFARLDEAEVKEFNLDEVITDTIRILQPKWALSPSVEISGFQSFSLNGHPLKISQIIMNLLDNAYYAATEKNGVAQAKVSLHIQSDQEQVIIEVTDNGAGVPSEVIDTVFDPFITTKPIGTGTGMGLAISWSAADEHGGKLIIANTDSNGSTFRLSLPIANGAKA